MKNIFLIIIAIIIAVLFAFRLKDDWLKYKFLKEEAKSLEEKKEKLLEEETRLESLIEEISREEIFEKEARLMLGLKKEGERVVLIMPPEAASPTPEQLKNKGRYSVNFFSSFVKKFLNFLSNIYNIYNIKK